MTETMITIPNLVETVGMLAGLLTTTAFRPQAFKFRHGKPARGVSLMMFACFCTGIALNVINGFTPGAFPVILANVLTLCIAAAILVFKTRYG